MENNNLDPRNFPYYDEREDREFDPDEMAAALEEQQALDELYGTNDPINPFAATKELINDDNLFHNEEALRTGNVEPGSEEAGIYENEMAHERHENPELDEDELGPQPTTGLDEMVQEFDASVQDPNEQQAQEDREQEERNREQEERDREYQASLQTQIDEEQRQAELDAAAQEAASLEQTQSVPEATPEQPTLPEDHQPEPEPESEPEPTSSASEDLNQKEKGLTVEPEPNVVSLEQLEMWNEFGTVHDKRDLANVRLQKASFLKRHLKNVEPMTIRVGDKKEGTGIEVRKFDTGDDIKSFGVALGKGTSQQAKEQTVRLALQMMIQQMNKDLEPGEPISTEGIKLTGGSKFIEIAERELKRLEMEIENGTFRLPNGSEPSRFNDFATAGTISHGEPVAEPSLVDKAKDAINDLKDMALEAVSKEDNTISRVDKEPELASDGPVAFEDMPAEEQARINAEMAALELEGKEIAAEMAATEDTGPGNDQFEVQAQQKETEAALEQMQSKLSEPAHEEPDELEAEPELEDDYEDNEFDPGKAWEMKQAEALARLQENLPDVEYRKPESDMDDLSLDDHIAEFEEQEIARQQEAVVQEDDLNDDPGLAQQKMDEATLAQQEQQREKADNVETAIETGLLLEASRQAHAQEKAMERHVQAVESGPAVDNDEMPLTPYQQEVQRKELEAKQDLEDCVAKIQSGEYKYSDVNRNHPDVCFSVNEFKQIQNREYDPTKPQPKVEQQPQREHKRERDFGPEM